MYRKNTAGQFVCVQLLLTATGAVATGLSPTVRRCLDGTFAAATGTVTEDSAGFYKFAMSQADTNANDVSLTFSATGAIPVCINFVTTACDPTNAATFGITDIDATISSRMATFTPLTAAQIATGVWQDTVAGDFTVALSVGKSLMNGVALGTGLTVNALTTNNDKTGYSLTQSFPANFASLGIGASGHIITVDTVTTVTNQLTAAAIATGVWTDTTAGDFTTALSVGKSVMNGVSLGTGLTVNAVTGLTASNLDATISSRMATYTQPTGFLAATFPTTVASPTNITSITGNITGNLSGSVGSVTGAAGSVTGAVGSVTGNVGGNVVGSVASVTARVTANTDQVNGNATAASNVSKSMQAIVRGTCSGGTTTTAVVSSMTSPATMTASGQLIGRTILFDSDTSTAALQGQASNITANTTGSTPTITFTAMTTAPANGDTFSVV